MAIEGVPPFIAAQLNYLIAHSPFPVKAEPMWSGSKNNPWIDRFTILMPFCLDYVKWDLLFNVQNPLVAPDLIFGPDDDMFYPSLFSSEGGVEECGNASSGGDSFQTVLSGWNYKDPSALLSLILKLRELYSVYHRNRAMQVDDERLKFEISTILSREGIEMCMSPGIHKMEEVKFAVPLLEIDINKMVPACPWRHQQKIFLQVMYPVAKKYSSAPSAPRLKLVSTADLKSLFSVEDVKLSSWVNGMCMAEYLPSLEETLEMQVLEAVSLIGVRRNFIEALAPMFGRPLEADPIFCRRATVLVANGIFAFLVHFVLPHQFPKQQPTLILQCSQYFNSQGIPIRAVVSDYPWSPRWEPPIMAERIFDFLVDESLSFKKQCSEAILQQHQVQQ